MKGWHGGFISSAAGGGRKAVLESEDLEEEEVWATVKAREAGSKTRKKYSSSSSSSAWRRSKARSVPEDDGCRQEVAADEWVAPQQSSSVPVNAPADDWSKILKKRSKKKMWGDDTCDAHNDDDHGKVDEASENDDDEMVPPHEYLARRLANSQIASHSMCEGVGRTLKGRDLSKLRNAILTKTGFIE